MSTQRLPLPALFEAQRDKAVFEYLKCLPASLLLPAEAVHCVRAVAGDHLARDRHRLAGAFFRRVIV